MDFYRPELWENKFLFFKPLLSVALCCVRSSWQVTSPYLHMDMDLNTEAKIMKLIKENVEKYLQPWNKQIFFNITPQAQAIEKNIA